MADRARLRASDADRDRTAAALREHLSAGRLTTEEFDERLDKAFAAKTLGELDELMADLPAAGLDRLPSAGLERSAGSPLPGGPRPARPVEGEPGRFAPARRAAWGSWLAISLVLLMIWLVSGARGDPWFLWVVLALGVLMAGRWIRGAQARRERRSARPRRNHGHRDDEASW